MEGWLEFIAPLAKFCYENYSLSMIILSLCVVAIVYIIVNLIKKPIKYLTSKYIKNKNTRTLVNKSIILISFGVSIGIWYLLNWVLPTIVQIDWLMIALSGALPVVGYAFKDGFISKEQAKSAIEDLTKITEDGKLDKNDESAVKDYLNKVK